MPEIAISTENLTRRFGELLAVDNVNLQVESGQFFGFLGPNGAGKSTTIKMLTTCLRLAPPHGAAGIDLPSMRRSEASDWRRSEGMAFRTPDRAGIGLNLSAVCMARQGDYAQTQRRTSRIHATRRPGENFDR